MSRPRPAVVGLVLVALCAGAATALPRPPAQAVPTFEPATFEAHLRFLADDLLEGRGIGTRGGRLAAAYIEAVFRAAGLEPGSSEGFLQKVPMSAFAPDPEASITIERG